MSPKRGRCAVVVLIVCLSLGAFGPAVTAANGEAQAAQGPTPMEVGYDPFEATFSTADPGAAEIAVYDPFDQQPIVLPVREAAPALDEHPPATNYHPAEFRIVGPVRFAQQQEPYRLRVEEAEELPAIEPPEDDSEQDPCAAVAQRPLGELTINIEMTEGELPEDFAAACRRQRGIEFGTLAVTRGWPLFTYQWDATCFCHRPLYFEEINLERYGYGCHGCLQFAASGAHFFATVPALPYCMAAEFPGECIYTLRHYRPGSCPPWRYHYPPCDGLAGATQAGVLTGLIFLIP